MTVVVIRRTLTPDNLNGKTFLELFPVVTPVQKRFYGKNIRTYCVIVQHESALNIHGVKL